MFGMPVMQGNFNGRPVDNHPEHVKKSFEKYLSEFKLLHKKLHSLIVKILEYKFLRIQATKLINDFTSKTAIFDESDRRVILSNKEIHNRQQIKLLIPELEKEFSRINIFLFSTRETPEQSFPILLQQNLSIMPRLPNDIIHNLADYLSQNEYCFLRRLNQKIKTAVDATPIQNDFVLFGNFLVILKHLPPNVEISYSILITARQNILSRKRTHSHHAILADELRAEILDLARPEPNPNCCNVM